ncbi:MAG: DNA-3-methyladenine glycosylase I [Chloroflexota bacterium]|nr:MAG: DNA-3-methyladenine glycosylase I [Chloroflexota bacterium]
MDGQQHSGRPVRCFDGDELLRSYHDQEWGRPITDERGLYERLCLEAFQSGISWQVVLRKRDALRAAFENFEPDRVAAFDQRMTELLLSNLDLIRNRAKIGAVISNARATLALRTSTTPLPVLIWSFRQPVSSAPRSRIDVPSTTDASRALATTLKAHGFRFIGPTTVYALMQAVGLVNDHLAACIVREEVEAEHAAMTSM